MKKVLMIALALVISVAFVATGFAQPKPVDKPAAAPEKAAPEKPAKMDKPAKGKGMQIKGEVLKIDTTEKVIVVKGKKGEEVIDIKDVKWKVYKGADEVKAGDFVVVTVMDKEGKKVATVVTKGKPGKKAAPKSADKPAAAPEKPAAPAAPAK